MIAAASTHAKSRAPLLGAVALVALVAGLRTAAPPPRTIEGVAAALGDTVGGTVKPDDFLWEERGDFLHDAFVGRRVLFLASRNADGKTAPRDLYRAKVRLTRAGRPIAIGEARNLTRTPLGDDRDLTGSGHRVAFTTATIDGVQGVTLLDLDGSTDRSGTLVSRVWKALDRLATTGTTRGLARTEIAFGQPPTEVKLEVGPSALVLALGSEGVPAALDYARGSLQIGGTTGFDATVSVVPELPRPAGVVLVELAGAAFGDVPERLTRAVFESAPHLPSRREDASAPEGLRIAADYPSEGGWPPPPLAPPNARPFDGEGFWHVAPAAQGPAQQVAAPPLLEALVRPDVNDPDALVRFVAIDTRRLDVRVVPGAALPAPEAGPHGSGRLPRGEDAKKIVAAFAAGPAFTLRAAGQSAATAGQSASPTAGQSAATAGQPAPHDAGQRARGEAPRALGFFGEGRLFAPLVTGAPALAVRPDGHAALGVWPEGAVRDAFVAVAQGPEIAASGAFPLADEGGRRARAALCRTASGYLLYAFAASARPASLEAGLALAGCAASLVIGAEPANVGFAYVRATVAEDGATTFGGTSVSPVMSMPVDRLGDVQLEATGVLVLRDQEPESFSSKKLAWAADAGKQPPPAWLPGVLSFDTEELGAKVKVTAFLPGRATYRLATGTDEGTGSRGDKPGPTAQERGTALAALGLSVARRASRRGHVVRGTEIVKPSRGGAWLVLDGGRVSLVRVGEALPAGADATELPMTADEHKLLPAAREVGTQRPRTALCALPDGTVVIAHTSFDTDEAPTEALLDVGCERVIVLDRGAHDGVFVHRAGEGRPPEASYEATAIYVLPAAGTGTATDIK